MKQTVALQLHAESSGENALTFKVDEEKVQDILQLLRDYYDAPVLIKGDDCHILVRPSDVRYALVVPEAIEGEES